MALAGDEKKIQALFRELKFEDEHVTPAFVGMWNRAHSTTQKPRPVFHASFAVIAALIILTLVSVVHWSRNRQQVQQSVPGATFQPVLPVRAPALATATPGPKPPRLVKSFMKPETQNPKPKTRNPKLETRNVPRAVTISSWQSPTLALMRSQAAEVLTSLPQLDRSVNELKTVLPNTPK